MICKFVSDIKKKTEPGLDVKGFKYQALRKS